MDITQRQQIPVHGVDLETWQIEGPKDRPVLVFLHEGLGSVALWRDWPQKLCQRLGLPGLVYSRQGYGQSDIRPDVRGEPRSVGGVAQGRLQPDYMHHEARVVLPELLRAFPGRLRIAVAEQASEDALARRYGATRRPSLVFLRGGQYVTTVAGMLDWDDYLAAVAHALQMPVTRAPGIGIPVVAASGGCH